MSPLHSSDFHAPLQHFPSRYRGSICTFCSLQLLGCVSVKNAPPKSPCQSYGRRISDGIQFCAALRALDCCVRIIHHEYELLDEWEFTEAISNDTVCKDCWYKPDTDQFNSTGTFQHVHKQTKQNKTQ
jgi:hypothetical protein